MTDSRNTDVVVWQNEDGTVFADNADQVVASGEDFSAVLQAAVDAGASMIAIQEGHYVAEDRVRLEFDTIVTGMGTGTTIEVAGSAGFWIEGEKTGSARLTSDASTDDSRISVADTSPFSVDGLVFVNTDRRTD